MKHAYVTLRHVAAVLLLAVGVVGLGLASPAEAHQGSIKVSGTQCVDADTMTATYTWTWSNVPPDAYGTQVVRKTGSTTFGGDWDGNGGQALVTIDKAEGSASWTVTLDKSAFTSNGKSGPWEYVYSPWKNGYSEQRHHDTRVENFDWSGCAPDTSEGKITFCHANEGNGYNLITTSKAAFYVGHREHAKDIYPAGSYEKGGQSYSWNAQGDQSLLQTGCEQPDVKDAAASVSVTEPTCEGPSTATFVMEHVTANPASPDQSVGTHTVVFTAEQGHTFANGDTTKSVEYTIQPQDDCVKADASASVDVTPPTCDTSSTASFVTEHATANPASPDQSVGTHTVVFTAEQGHTFANGDTTKSVEYTIQPQDDCVKADASASVDVTPPTCDTTSTASFVTEHATANPASPDQSVGTHTVVFTAEQGHTFANGDTTLELDYTIQPQDDCTQTQTIPLTPEVAMHDECGTANDTGPTYVEENEYWTAETVDDTVVFTAKPGYLFEQPGDEAVGTTGFTVSEDGTTVTIGFEPNTDKPCPPEVKGEQETKHHHHHSTPDVKGEQATAPATATVPTAVDAGLGTTGTPAGRSGGSPLWLLVVGAGIGLIGYAGARRRGEAG